MSLALIFPGQGAQGAGMGIGLLDPGSPGHELALEGSELTGLDLVRLSCDAGDEEIRATEVAQPLLLLHSVALLRQLPGDVVSAVTAVAGHSLGEYTALVASGALEWRSALTLVRERGLAMAEAGAAAGGDQGMSAVLGLDAGPVQGVLDDVEGVVVVANINAPGQVVISGERAAVEVAAARLKIAGARRVLTLAVAGAFHSPLMAGAAERLGAALDATELNDGKAQAFNVDARIRTASDHIREALKRQLSSAVLWTDCVATLQEHGVDRFIELGPGGTLTAMGKRIASTASWEAVNTAASAAALEA